jgi:hypothetical protein
MRMRLTASPETRRPIYGVLWNRFQREFEEELRHRTGPRGGEAREEVLRDVVRFASLRTAERVLSRGWDTKKRRGLDAKKKPSRIERKPIEKPVNLGADFVVILREPTPLELIDVLAGELRRSTPGSSGVDRGRGRMAGDVTRGRGRLPAEGTSPEEFALLLRAARAPAPECTLNALVSALYEIGQAAFDDLSGGRTRNEMVEARRARRMEPEITLSHGSEESAFDDPEEPFIEKEDELPLDLPQDDRLTDRDRAIIEARAEGKTWRKIATDLGISYGYARNLGSILEKKNPRP